MFYKIAFLIHYTSFLKDLLHSYEKGRKFLHRMFFSASHCLFTLSIDSSRYVKNRVSCRFFATHRVLSRNPVECAAPIPLPLPPPVLQQHTQANTQTTTIDGLCVKRDVTKKRTLRSTTKNWEKKKVEKKIKPRFGNAASGRKSREVWKRGADSDAMHCMRIDNKNVQGKAPQLKQNVPMASRRGQILLEVFCLLRVLPLRLATVPTQVPFQFRRSAWYV